MNKSKQNSLRAAITTQVTNYLGYAEDVHNDYISVNENTLEVGFRSRHEDNRLPGVEYYPLFDLIEPKELWFKPNLQAIEVIVQEHLPSQNVKELRDNAINSITDFLVANTPSDLRTCKICIGAITNNVSCFDAKNVDDTVYDAADFVDDEDIGCYAFFPLKDAVSKISTGYNISGYKLTKIVMNCINPE